MRPQLLVLAMLVLTAAPLSGFASADGYRGAGNGFVMMVHGHVETPFAGVVMHPPPLEAVGATRDGDAYELAVIPYATWTERPEQVWDTYLVVVTSSGARLHVEPLDGFGSLQAVCEAETSLPGHEGDVEACDVFRIPADAVEGGFVTLEYHFRYMDTVLSEPYSALSHALLHQRLDGGSASMEDADARDEPTPFLLHG